MARVLTNGKMAGCITVNTATIKNMALVYMSGSMEELTSEIGPKANKIVKEFIFSPMVQ